jgi:hypothetical protein
MVSKHSKNQEMNLEGEWLMSTKSMFFRIVISELIFFGTCIFIFVANLAFWLDEKGAAERIFNINLTPSLIPIFFLGIIYSLAIFTFTIVLSKQVKRLQVSNYNNSKKAFLLSIGSHLLAFSSSSIILVVQDSSSMKTVVPSLFSLYFATIFILLLMLYFPLFVRTNKNKIEI